jgi:tetratricopeptide (TPR) repeat protein
MKATNLRPLKLQLLLQSEERKLSKHRIIFHKKAAVTVCLFLFIVSHTFSTTPADTQWTFDDATQQVYNLVLNLQVEEAYQSIHEPETPQQQYVIALAEALELLITEDGEKYTAYEEHFNRRLERKTKTTSPDDLFLQAEIRLQWCFVYLKFGHEFDAALNLRQAYFTIQEIKNRFPRFEAVKKTSGVLEVLVGSVPQKYNWVLGLLGMEGSTKKGMEGLESLITTNGPFMFECALIQSLLKGYLFQDPEAGLQTTKNLLAKNPKNRLALFLAGALAIKSADSDEALEMLDSLSGHNQGLAIYYADYLRGEINLYKGEYLNSISSYRWFINHYNGQNGIKDAYYKIGLCYWLNGNVNDAQATFKQAKSAGKEASESDKYAARSLSEDELPHVKLTKARYATDGGYYTEALQILASILPSELPTKRDQVEFFYRKARVAHKLNDILNAKGFYQECIDSNAEEPWYYAPNACLQLGYLFMDDGDMTTAKNYFMKALSYNKHEYKNSIDSKAKSAIAQIKRK